jgi:hypothetical protein
LKLYSKTKLIKAGGMAQVVEHLSSKHMTLSSKPNTAKINKHINKHTQTFPQNSEKSLCQEVPHMPGKATWWGAVTEQWVPYPEVPHPETP